jgi:hypothetical protein
MDLHQGVEAVLAILRDEGTEEGGADVEGGGA